MSMLIFISLGIIASIFQLLILREFTFSIAKNELSFVAGVGVWLISITLGSIYRTIKKNSFLTSPLLLSILICICVALIHLVKPIFGIKYFEATSFTFALISGAILILPSAFLLGYIFADFVRRSLQETQEKNIYAKFFAFEAIGFFLGSIIFTFLLSNYSNPLAFGYFCLLLIPAIKETRKKIISIVLIILVSTLFSLGFKDILKREFAGAKIIESTGSRYGPVIITDKNGVKSLFASGSLIATSEDLAWNEEFIHMSLSAKTPEEKIDVLYIGAALSYEIDEIAKHRIKSLDCVDINPLISTLARSRLPKSLKIKVNFISDDPRVYLKNTPKRYDAILMNMSAPSNLALNRYYSREFFNLISSRLTKNGIFAFHIPSKRDILSPQVANFNSSIINSLKGTFKSRFLIPGDEMIIIAANENEISSPVLLRNYSKSKIKTDFFTLYHFKDYLDEGIRNYTEKTLNKTIPVNSDLTASGFLNYLLLEQLKFYPGLKVNTQHTKKLLYAIIAITLIVLIILGLINKKAKSLINIWLVGFISISFSSAIFVLFQLYSGALFWKAGLLIALFMAGLSLGVMALNSNIYKLTAWRAFIPALYISWALLITTLLFSLNKIAGYFLSDILFYLYSLLGGSLTGAAYPIFTRCLLEDKISANNVTIFTYASDLSGAFLGTLTSAIFLLPFLGVEKSLIVLIIISLTFGLKNLLS